MKLLLAEDDAKLAQHLVSNLKEIGFNTDHVSSVPDFLQAMESSTKLDFIVLDRLLGPRDSKEVLPAIRKRHPLVPILVLSAISTPNEKTDLLNLGADDYLSKPFSTQELVARIRALVRRTSLPSHNYIQVGNITIDSTKRIITVDGKTTLLSAKEFLLLHTLSQQIGKVWKKNDLLDYIWGQTSDVETNVVEATITNVRKKLMDLGASAQIKNMRNVGYWVEE